MPGRLLSATPAPLQVLLPEGTRLKILESPRERVRVMDV